MPTRRAATISLMAVLLTLTPPSSSLAAPRVVNGATTQEYPTTGALLAKYGALYLQACSGTLVGCRTFLTAAHCVCGGLNAASCGAPNPAAHAVYLQHVGIVGVAAITIDPSFEFTHQGDLAIITLAEPVEGIVPAPINSTMSPPPGTIATIAGFGRTRSDVDDSGLLRAGVAITSGCPPDIDSGNHVCWDLTSPLDLPGADSSTCQGDSGGPLFADLGSGPTLIGVTSGGSGNNCLPPAHAFDADVYQHVAFVESIAGGDLGTSSCGSVTPVGAPGASVTTFSFDLFTKEQQNCRKTIAKMSVAYTSAVLKSAHSCIDAVGRGTISGPCPDARMTLALANAAERVDAKRIAASCSPNTLAGSRLGGVCSGAADADDVAGCIVAAGNDGLERAIALAYADEAPAASMTEGSPATCQRALSRALLKLTRSAPKAGIACQFRLASGNIPYSPGRIDACPDSKSTGQIQKLINVAAGAIHAACSDAAVAALDAAHSFGGGCAGVSSVAELISCEMAEHDSWREQVLSVLTDEVMTQDFEFEVPAGTTSLRVTLNGRDNGDNDLNLLLRYGGAPTDAVYDFISNNVGVFESISLDDPTPGTWHGRITRYIDTLPVPYQVTITTRQ